MNHDAISVQICLSAGLSEQQSDALLTRLSGAPAAAQPDPAMAEDDLSDEDLFTIHDEHFPTMILGHENYLRFARALLKRARPASGDAARYRWLRSSHVGPESLASLHQWVNDDCNPPYTELKYGDELDAAIDAAMQQGGQP